MTQPPLDWQPSPNYTKGRQGTPVRKITFHHVVGSAASAVTTFKNPLNEKSAHFVVAPNKIYCCVDTDNTAWTNTNFASNLESVTIEHEGDWRNGYRNEGVLNQSAILVAWLRTLYPTATFNRHREVSLKGTVCPADFPVEEVWNKATAILNPPKPVPAPAPPTEMPVITDITNRMVVTNKDANLWDLSFNTWAEAKSVKVIPKGTQVEVSAIAKHKLGGSYYLTEYSFSKGINNGINVADCSEIPTPPPVVVPPVEPPIEPPVEPPVAPPLDDETVGLLQSILLKLGDIIKSITDFLTRRGK
jgi:N-acetylmuramoyl-L-alanine amidase CwlA